MSYSDNSISTELISNAKVGKLVVLLSCEFDLKIL